MKKSTDKVIVTAIDATPYSAESLLKLPPLSCQLQLSSLTCFVGPHRAQLRAYLLMLAGISKPESGTVQVLGQQVCELDSLAWQKFRMQIGYLSGASPLLSSQPALMNVMLPLLYHLNLSYRDAEDKAAALLAELNCEFEATMYPVMLNSLQRTQLALARALILDPLFFILDLPFNDLGAKERQKMAGLLAENKQNRTVCMIGGLQYPRFLEQHANHIVFVSEHQLIHFNSWNTFMHSEDKEVQALLSFFRG